MLYDTINLENNDLESLDNDTFIQQKLIGVLYGSPLKLNNNKLKIIPSGLFNYMNYVEKIYLNNNTIEIIQYNAFRNLSSLVLIDLSFNKIKTIEKYAFYISTYVIC